MPGSLQNGAGIIQHNYSMPRLACASGTSLWSAQHGVAEIQLSIGLSTAQQRLDTHTRTFRHAGGYACYVRYAREVRTYSGKRTRTRVAGRRMQFCASASSTQQRPRANQQGQRATAI